MLCPKCKSETKIYDSRKLFETTVRVRECVNCGYRFRTTEKFLEPIIRHKRREK